MQLLFRQRQPRTNNRCLTERRPQRPAATVRQGRVERHAAGSAVVGADPREQTFAIEVLSAVDGSAEVALGVAPEIHNVIGSLQSSGLVAHVAATGLAAIIAAAPDPRQLQDLTPLGSIAHIEFIAPARSRLVGRSTLTDDAICVLRAVFAGSERKAQTDTPVEIIDVEQTVVCREPLRANVAADEPRSGQLGWRSMNQTLQIARRRNGARAHA